ncbi:MAG TPA: pantoate--beta-alanine ligase [Chitinophagaceae bacterium]|nr:pantoate--beta-alanine ligase [Chitinophagaceae bacterium]
MIIIKKAKALSGFLLQRRNNHQLIGFVPTMGALHPGHLALINTSTKTNDLTVCSIFVNPTQFNNSDDFQKYPVTIEKDIKMLEQSGCDVLFLPPVSEIYPMGLTQLENYDLGLLEKILEGKFRPGHFQGVCQVVHRLLEIIKPQFLYLGQKDYQQCLVIKKLLSIRKLNIQIVIVPTVRETDGLAMSSRNKRLTVEAREQATEISKTLLFVKENMKKGETNKLINAATLQLLNKGFKIDYITIASAENLTEVNEWNGKSKIVVLAAAFINGVRLIDNMLIN